MVVVFSSGKDAGKIAGIRTGRKAGIRFVQASAFLPQAAVGLGQQQK
jgi:hypothetical protein